MCEDVLQVYVWADAVDFRCSVVDSCLCVCMECECLLLRHHVMSASLVCPVGALKVADLISL